MPARTKTLIREADRYIIWTVVALTGFGLVAVYSSISFMAASKSSGSTELFLMRHVIRIGLALGAVLLFSRIDYRVLVRYGRLALIGALVLLVAVQLNGIVSGGAARWIRIGPMNFQPSDLARVALLLHVAALLNNKQKYITDLHRAFIPLLIWILPTILLVGRSDLSTAALVLGSVVLMCFVGRVSLLHLGSCALLLVFAAGILLATSPQRLARLEAYFGVTLSEQTDANTVFDPQGEGYQAQQARIAIVMGGITGLGPGKSVQRDFLPAPYNDFIFAIITEEYGMIGAFLLLILFSVLLFRGYLRIARWAPDAMGLFLATGITTMIVLYGFIHAGVATGLLPVTGLPMPFVSYGGTSMLANGVLIGVLLNISRQTND